MNGDGIARARIDNDPMVEYTGTPLVLLSFPWLGKRVGDWRSGDAILRYVKNASIGRKCAQCR